MGNPSHNSEELRPNMNIFRSLGDICHLLSFLVLLWKIHSSKSVAGISFKTQICLLITFSARYLDLFWNFASMYNWVMKVMFISCTVAIVYIMKYGTPQRTTYNAELDAFPVQYMIAGCAVCGVLVNQDHKALFEYIWAFSIYLEAVAIVPQLFMLQKQGEVENMTSHYVFFLGIYRLFYLFNWIYRYMTEDDYVQLIVWFSGVVQTALFLDFFYNYYHSKKNGIDKTVKITLPV